MSFLEDFESGSLDPAAFGHVDHVRAAHALLRDAPFFEAAARYEAALLRLLEKVDAPEKYSATLTFAFLSLIAEAMTERPLSEDAAAFLAAHPALLSGDALAGIYPAERFADPLSRRVPLLPRGLR